MSLHTHPQTDPPQHKQWFLAGVQHSRSSVGKDIGRVSMMIHIYDDLCALFGCARMPAGDQALFRILVGTGEVGGTGRVMRSYLVQNITRREECCCITRLPTV